MYNTVSVEEALEVWERYEGSPSLLVGDNLWVYGSHKALSRVQAYILSDSSHPVERKDVNLYLAFELKQAEAEIKRLKRLLEEANDRA